jgi:hypothetical protein
VTGDEHSEEAPLAKRKIIKKLIAEIPKPRHDKKKKSKQNRQDLGLIAN